MLLATAAMALMSLVVRWRRARLGRAGRIRAFAVLAVGLVGWYVGGGALLSLTGSSDVSDIAPAVFATDCQWPLGTASFGTGCTAWTSP
jgi:hypothetical protein